MYLTLSFCTFGFMWIKKSAMKRTVRRRKSCGNRAKIVRNLLVTHWVSVVHPCENRAEIVRNLHIFTYIDYLILC